MRQFLKRKREKKQTGSDLFQSIKCAGVGATKATGPGRWSWPMTHGKWVSQFVKRRENSNGGRVEKEFGQA